MTVFAAEPHFFQSCCMISSEKNALFRDVVRRAKSLFWLKTLGVPSFMVLFFWGYIYILKHAVFPVTVMPLTAIDRLIPYQDSAWLFYVSLWIYVQFPLTLIDNRWQFVLYGWSAAGVSLIGFAIFVLWPTAVPSLGSVEGGYWLASIRSIDTTGNSCPSLHVAFAVFSAVWLERFLRHAGFSVFLRFLNVAWCLGIIYSTLATKQHVMLDAYAGAALGFIGAAVQARLEKCRREKNPSLPVSPKLAQISPEARKL